jgi:1,4-dihydroxy-2-naphthoate octaprenyltransferase
MAALAELFLLLTAGVLAFGIGTLLAGAAGYPVRPEVWGPGLVGTCYLILAALCSREAFAPGCGRGPAWQGLSPRGWKMLAYACLGGAGVCGLFLQFAANTGDFTIPLGALGVLLGYFCFAPPLAWHRRGLGEVAGALAFGLLPVLTAFYIQCGHLITEILVHGLALSFASFNVFLAYGMPGLGDPEGMAPGTLAARLGPAGSGLVYTLVNVLIIFALVFIYVFPASPLPTRPGLLALLLPALVNQELVKRRAYMRRDLQPWLLALSAAMPLGMGLTFALGIYWRN